MVKKNRQKRKAVDTQQVDTPDPSAEVSTDAVSSTNDSSSSKQTEILVVLADQSNCLRVTSTQDTLKTPARQLVHAFGSGLSTRLSKLYGVDLTFDHDAVWIPGM
jgi:ATP-dependent protease HslVU (ClpYQ) peptidase subunit